MVRFGWTGVGTGNGRVMPPEQLEGLIFAPSEFESKSAPSRKNPSGDEPFRVEAGRGRDSEEPQTLGIVKEIMLFVVDSGRVALFSFSSCDKSQPRCSVSNRRTQATYIVGEKIAQGW